MIILGIDPGVNGGMALIDTEKLNSKVFSFSDKTEVDIAIAFAEVKCALAFIEKVHSAPGQGVKSMFTFGQSYGFLRGLLVANKIPFWEITPQEWQRILGVPTRNGKTYNEHKKILKGLAQRLYPSISVDYSTADSLLIAHAGVIKYKRENYWDI